MILKWLLYNFNKYIYIKKKIMSIVYCVENEYRATDAIWVLYGYLSVLQTGVCGRKDRC